MVRQNRCRFLFVGSPIDYDGVCVGGRSVSVRIGGAEIGIAFLVAGLGVKLLGKLAVESMRV